MAEALLVVEALSKRFGGLLATDQVSFEVEEGEFHAIIGPNGAGKTTLIGQLTGEIRPDAGVIRFAGRDVTRLHTTTRSALGLGRSFQITSVFGDFSALDNVAIAVQSRQGHSFRFLKPARSDASLRDPARAVLQQVGLAGREDVLVSELAHGEKRALEIAMALATKPRLLLLDEPMAGMGPEESARMVQLLRSLRGSCTLVLVEHDMNAVFALADRITVLVYGRSIFSGTPEKVRLSAAVRQAYLGEGAAA